MDKAAVSRAKQHGVDLAVRYEGRYPSGPNGEALPSYQVAVSCQVGGTPQDRERALTDIEKFLTPAPIREIEGWLAELSVICAKRRDGEFDEALRLDAYASRLSQYPADVARNALLGRAWHFWPTWAELEKVCDSLAAPRRHMAHALAEPFKKPEPERRPPTEAEKQRIAELVEELFPDVSQLWRDSAVAEMTKDNGLRRKAGVA